GRLFGAAGSGRFVVAAGGGWCLPAAGRGQLVADPAARQQQPGDAGIQVGELAVEHFDGGRALGTGLPSGSQAVHERPGLLQVEPELEQGSDLLDQSQVDVVVVAISVRGPASGQQTLLFVVAQRPGAGAGLLCEFTDPHAATVNLDTDVNANRGMRVSPAPPLDLELLLLHRSNRSSRS